MTNMYRFTVHNHRCKECKKEDKELEGKRFKEVIESHEGFVVKGIYKSKLQPIKIIHKTCGNEWGVLPEEFVKDVRCTKCNPNRQKKTHEDFLEDVHDLYKNEYLVLGVYTSNRNHILMKHTVCGHSWEVEPRNFLINKRGCPKCNLSKGERKIENYLKKVKLKFESQFKDENCKNKRLLPFDFKVEHLLIEYDGELHFTEGRFSKDRGKMKDKLINTQRNDLIKNTYCLTENIPLVRIPYWKFDNIEYILDHILGYFKLIDKTDVDESLVNKFLVNHPSWSQEEYIKQAAN